MHSQPVHDIQVQKLKMPTEASQVKRRKMNSDGIRSNLYNPIREELSTINLATKLFPYFSTLQHKPQYTQVWPQPGSAIPLVQSKFGNVPRGSVLSYQQQAETSSASAQCIEKVQLPATICLPRFTFDNCIAGTYCYVANEDEQSFFNGLHVNSKTAGEYEKNTRCQSTSTLWHKLRAGRLTASNFKSIVTRRGNNEKLVQQLLRTKNFQSAAMKHGIEYEPIAAESYASTFKRNVYCVGFVINPSAPHLGASPDRQVYDSQHPNPFGLLEIKCPSVDTIMDCKYLHVNRQTGNLQLKRSDAYYYQVMGQLGITGSEWCDFFVYARNDYHVERIYFDANMFADMKLKLDQFYFEFFLPQLIVKNTKTD